MTRTLIALLLLCSSAFADNITNLYSGQTITNGMQLTSVYYVAPAGGGYTYYPTNVSKLYAAYIAPNYTTNAGVATLPDMWTSGTTLSNTVSSQFPSVIS